MRKIKFSNEFDYVLSWFTSIGYFSTHFKNILVIKNIHQALKTGGILILDINNFSKTLHNMKLRTHPEWTLVPEYSSVYELSDGTRIKKVSKFDRMKRKLSTLLEWTKDGRDKKMHYEVRLFPYDEIITLLQGIGFKILQTWGSNLGEEFSDTSPRLIIKAQKI
ncbi:MAG: putative methyltransferase type 11 [Parcubacteria group bacterium Gr01-1014_18]|nr:MAG: putative methyltransferase type 11 [Parcubacteria group bacterium Greene0416_36]TSC81078.1 MAG: putative methyltransferase type 11 [Parcubacteria group bacterium Gr01-1014_18]TSC98812.1 MAG: putative methyltransferase type 11 [Parcubacteria group bacterium Greene1014_20]TSD06708.1 MAG: putative methyltransferase type 11 [Parcubacteria group bacterium Greene0714_2]